MIDLIVVLKIKDQQNLPLLRELLAQQILMSRQEPGCIRMDALESQSEPGTFTLVEEWASQEALDAHRKAHACTTLYFPKIVPLVDRTPHMSTRLTDSAGAGSRFNRARLMELIRERALKFGDFTLASGKKSPYYLDGKQVTLSAEGLMQISYGLLELLGSLEFSGFGGMSIGADPIVGGVLVAAATQGRSLQGFMVRKEAKGHGTQRFIEGPIQPGDRVVIVDDVVTTGGSALQAVDRVEEFGCRVVHAVGIVDRLQGGAAAFQARNIPFSALLTIRDFGITPPAE